MSNKFLILSWTQFMDMSLDLAEKILNSRFIPDVVVAILRGGYFVAKLISDFLGLDNIATLEIKFYKGIGNIALEITVEECIYTIINN